MTVTRSGEWQEGVTMTKIMDTDKKECTVTRAALTTVILTVEVDTGTCDSDKEENQLSHFQDLNRITTYIIRISPMCTYTLSKVHSGAPKHVIGSTVCGLPCPQSWHCSHTCQEVALTQWGALVELPYALTHCQLHPRMEVEKRQSVNCASNMYVQYTSNTHNITKHWMYTYTWTCRQI